MKKLNFARAIVRAITKTRVCCYPHMSESLVEHPELVDTLDEGQLSDVLVDDSLDFLKIAEHLATELGIKL